MLHSTALLLAILSNFATAANICGSNATIGTTVIAALNLSYPGLEAVQGFAKQGDLNSACEALAEYYRSANTSWWNRVPPVTPGNGTVGGQTDAMVFHDIFYLAGVDISAQVPRNAAGGLDWLDKGPRNDAEFMNCLNRHDSFVYTLSAWRATGNPVYSSYFNSLITDWATHLPCPDALSPTGQACVPLGLPGTPCSWGPKDTPGAQACKTGTMESPWRSLVRAVLQRRLRVLQRMASAVDALIGGCESLCCYSRAGDGHSYGRPVACCVLRLSGVHRHAGLSIAFYNSLNLTSVLHRVLLNSRRQLECS
jgi:hypothetical protein